MDDNPTIYTWEEIKKHNSEESCWVVIDNIVYDVTSYLEYHPGGPKVCLDNVGKDCLQQYIDAEHSKAADRMLKKYEIGILEEAKIVKQGNENEICIEVKGQE